MHSTLETKLIDNPITKKLIEGSSEGAVPGLTRRQVHKENNNDYAMEH